MNASPATVDDYVASFPVEVQAVLQELRARVRHAAPESIIERAVTETMEQRS